MKKMSYLLLWVLLSVPLNAAAARQDDTLKMLDHIPNDWQEANLRAWTNDGQTRLFKLGDEIKFHFRADRDCYITMVYVDSHGLLTVLSPDLGHGDNNLKAGQKASYPPEKADLRLTAEPPLGQEYVYVIATEKQTPLPVDGIYVDAYVAAEAISRSLTKKEKSLKVAKTKLQHIVQGRSEEIEYTTRDIVGYFSKTRALRPKVYEPQELRAYLELHIHFAFDSAELSQSAQKSLDEFGKSMHDPSLRGQRFIVAGHTDDVGPPDYNMELSYRRATAVKNYLVSQFGINPGDLLIEAYGESRPYVPQQTEEARTANRRVEFELNP
ncbi:MAG: OmpA family protein [Desulfobacterales bacterium]|nr:MAG: OmpA family protein [Desulfobacterales bacterium]